MQVSSLCFLFGQSGVCMSYVWTSIYCRNLEQLVPAVWAGPPLWPFLEATPSTPYPIRALTTPRRRKGHRGNGASQLVRSPIVKLVYCCVIDTVNTTSTITPINTDTSTTTTDNVDLFTSSYKTFDVLYAHYIMCYGDWYHCYISLSINHKV